MTAPVKLPLETAIELNAALDQIYMQATRLERASDNKRYLIGDLEIIKSILERIRGDRDTLLRCLDFVIRSEGRR